MAPCGIPNLPSGFLTGVTSTVSHSYIITINNHFLRVHTNQLLTRGTLATAKIFWTAAEISGPIPSPGIKVTLRPLVA